jgi:DNA-binding IclR family transcriptional regulator
MATSDRVLAVLGLFTVEEAEWTVEDAAARLDLAVSTAYRYFRSLSTAGLIVAFAAGRYTLGPAIIQYDRQIRLRDPLTSAAQPVMKRLIAQLPPHAVTLLCRLYSSQVMCVHQETNDNPGLPVSYERGRPMSLFRGAASKIILVNLNIRSLRGMFGKGPAEFSRAGFGKNWKEVKERLRELRSAGVFTTQGEIDPGMCGTSVPIFDSPGVVIGSLSVILPVRHITAEMLPEITDLLKRAADEVAWTLSLGGQGTVGGPQVAVRKELSTTNKKTKHATPPPSKIGRPATRVRKRTSA